MIESGGLISVICNLSLWNNIDKVLSYDLLSFTQWKGCVALSTRKYWACYKNIWWIQLEKNPAYIDVNQIVFVFNETISCILNNVIHQKAIVWTIKSLHGLITKLPKKNIKPTRII